MLHNVLEDEGFKISSANATTARTSAVKLLEWASKKESEAKLRCFGTKVTALLNQAFDSNMKRVNRKRVGPVP